MLPVDMAANAASLGAGVPRASTLGSFRRCLSEATELTRTTWFTWGASLRPVLP
jgi:hypothetical protein